MILQEAFRSSGYTDLLTVDAAGEYGLDLEGLFDSEQQPKELLSIFISEYGDELFFLLSGDLPETDAEGAPKTISDLCDQWDDRIRVFAIINGNNEAFKKLKYNIVQLLVYSGEAPDKSREGDLQITRKIIIKGDLKDQAHIVIDDDEAIELPFHMIPPDAFAPDADTLRQLHQLLPADADLLAIMKKPLERATRRRGEKGVRVQPMNYEEQHFKMIKEWLEK